MLFCVPDSICEVFEQTSGIYVVERSKLAIRATQTASRPLAPCCLLQQLLFRGFRKSRASRLSLVPPLQAPGM
ncbi:hypothetical protein Q8A67_024566 [Cirrhinus molitorella]|uniref:Uncharacterized protein n=1 Tax=Cirrhinus molitorella TaxID=172907 RepID=A0AA88P4V8_9TELE|nr:hypothetical protein Q8A67_024566 [Cirrhinus molitorella]